MIDTDKYEGHTEGPWKQYSLAAYHGVVLPSWKENIELILPKLADAKLIADAPLLLDAYKDKCEEVKRLQKELRKQTNIVGMISDLVYDGGSHNLTWDELNEILGDVVKE
jgi:hypothetical protein